MNRKGLLGGYMVDFYAYFLFIIILILFLMLSNITATKVTQAHWAYKSEYDLQSELISFLSTPLEYDGIKMSVANWIVSPKNSAAVKSYSDGLLDKCYGKNNWNFNVVQSDAIDKKMFSCLGQTAGDKGVIGINVALVDIPDPLDISKSYTAILAECMGNSPTGTPDREVSC